MYTSVVMINLNGGKLLGNALRTCRQDLEEASSRDTAIELLVVDNGSTDGSIEVIHAELRSARFLWRLVEEREAGVNAARNAGLASANGDFIVFCDSDIGIHAGWLAAYQNAARMYPEISVFAGRVRVGPISEEIPEWLDLSGRWKRSCIVVQADYGDVPFERPLSPEYGPVGPSMAFRRSIFEKAGRFDVRYGLRPGSLVPGAEAEFFDRLRRIGERFAWVPDAVVDHPVGTNQLSRSYFLKRLHGVGRVEARLARDRGDTPKRVCGLTMYRVPELMKAIARWGQALLTADPKEAFFYRGQMAILSGYLHEDFAVWKAQREALFEPYNRT